jgi:hypothetical protein
VRSYAAGLGDQDRLDEPTKVLIRRCSTLTMRAEAFDSMVVRGEEVDDEQMVRIANVLTVRLSGLTPREPPSQPSRSRGLSRHITRKSVSPLIEESSW